MKRGKFIALEGGEGTGKSTQARKLAEALENAGHEVVTTREPGGTPGAEAIRSLLLDPPGEGWGPKAEALLFAAARSDHVERLILPSLDAGRWVVCDRFVDSSRAYQGFAGQLGDDKVRALHAVGSDGIRPDLVILIDVSPDEIARRLSVRDADGSDAIGGRSADYHSRVAAAFRQMAEEDAAGFVVVDGNAGEETVHARILDAISGRFGDKL
ncbi:dTMP kinase [Erythrobacter sp. HKB08]|uniref:dTMP kinase n=1 Tax=Erythrobacter sp. HKB08 TaxID=2502843 RepID=UPI0010092A26|nr:dTMP kinase [Erythrobacter sp. HKB08]